MAALISTECVSKVQFGSCNANTKRCHRARAGYQPYPSYALLNVGPDTKKDDPSTSGRQHLRGVHAPARTAGFSRAGAAHPAAMNEPTPSPSVQGTVSLDIPSAPAPKGAVPRGSAPHKSYAGVVASSGPKQSPANQSQKGMMPSTLIKNHICEDCGNAYSLASSLTLHRKNCGKSDRRRCLFCFMEFKSFPAVRQHERRAHPHEYRRELESKVKMPGWSLIPTL